MAEFQQGIGYQVRLVESQSADTKAELPITGPLPEVNSTTSSRASVDMALDAIRASHATNNRLTPVQVIEGGILAAVLLGGIAWAMTSNRIRGLSRNRWVPGNFADHRLHPTDKRPRSR